MLNSAMNSFNLVLSLLRKKKPFSFSRFGDGEWFCIIGEEGMNCDDHFYYDNLRGELHNVIRKYDNQNNYYLALMPLVLKLGLLKGYEKDVENIYWQHSQCFWEASKNGSIFEFFALLQHNKTCVVGPEYLQRFKGWDYFIKIPLINCWLEKDRIVDSIKNICLKEDFLVVSISASMGTSVIIDELYETFGDIHTFIDVGSVYDPYIGVDSRKYHKKVIKKNGKQRPNTIKQYFR